MDIKYRYCEVNEMGRHGGGSRSGGSRSRSSSSRSHSGSRSRGSSSSVKSSKTPFRGCYNRSYYYRGRYHPYYTTDATFGTNSGFNVFKLIIAIFITIHMLLMLCTMGFSMISFGSKVDGNPDRIAIVDNIDILTPDEENKTLELLHDVYDKSGMPITIITDDFTWKDYYANIETYSEELYYTIGMDETAMVILFTQDDVGDFIDWEYDVYCGDDTVNCLSDETFDEFLDIFQKSMSKQVQVIPLKLVVFLQSCLTKMQWVFAILKRGLQQTTTQKQSSSIITTNLNKLLKMSQNYNKKLLKKLQMNF